MNLDLVMMERNIVILCLSSYNAKLYGSGPIEGEHPEHGN